MTLTPKDIQSKQFHVRFRGFDVEEVDGFLEQIAESFLELMDENKNLQSKVEAAHMELNSLKSEDQSFKEAIISAQKVAEEMKKKSWREANDVLTKAKAEAKQMKDEAQHEIVELESSVDRLQGMQEKLKNELKLVIHKYLSVIDEKPAHNSIIGDQELPDSFAKEAPVVKEEISMEGPDLSGLYEKIELDDDGGLIDDQPVLEDTDDDNSLDPAQYFADTPSEDEFDDEGLDETVAENIGQNLGSVGIDGIEEESLDDQDESPAIPDLDDDFMFTLEDPLDSAESDSDAEKKDD